MISGRVNARLEATLSLRIHGPHTYLDITAIIDTGFNGALTLPSAVVTALSLSPLTPMHVTLADTSRRAVHRFSAEIIWDQQRRTIRVVCVEGDPLLGTALLRDHKLEAEFADSGSVTVRALP